MKLFPLLALVLIHSCSSYKFLVYSPLFGHSHTVFMAKIADTLAAAGHEVTFLVPIVDIDHIGRKNVSVVKEVVVVEADPRVGDMMAAAHQNLLKQVWEMSPDFLSMMRMASNFTKSMAYSCEFLLKQDTLLEKLRNRKYDVGIAEPFIVCGLGLFEYLNIPSTIGALSITNLDLVSYFLGEPIAPSYVPSMSSAKGDRMNFLDRAVNAMSTVGQLKLMYDTWTAEAVYLEEKMGTNFSGIEDLVSKCSFMFTNANPYLNYPRPLIHKTVEIGGITIDVKEPGPLGEKWNKVLNERKHTVFISFGSNARSKDMPEHWKKSLLEMAASLPEVTFIWKYEAPTKMADHLPNVHLSPWLPQNALLADKRLSIFITHGGLGSTTEVAHLGKPSIMIPLFGDQPRNAEMLARHGGALVLNKQDLANSELIRQAVVKVLENNSYAVEAKKLAQMLKEQPLSARDLVVKHSTFVAKFGSLDRLEPYGRHLSLFRYYLLDVITALLFVVVILLAIIFFTLQWISRQLFRSQKSKTE